ncbi:SRPBCC family protein [bacterium]|nr:MAG: SRPBCC family protein [bacterium]
MKENIDFTVKKPPAEAFAALTDLDMMIKFGEDPKSPVKMRATRVDGRPKNGLGSAVDLTVQGAGQSMRMETVEWDPPKRCVRKLESPDLTAVVAFDFKEHPEGSLVTAELTIEAKSLLFKMMLPVLAKKIASEKLKLADKMKEGLA